MASVDRIGADPAPALDLGEDADEVASSSSPVVRHPAAA